MAVPHPGQPGAQSVPLPRPAFVAVGRYLALRENPFPAPLDVPVGQSTSSWQLADQASVVEPLGNFEIADLASLA
eukprot:8328141-Alexandrium_andersonii.AAC.1